MITHVHPIHGHRLEIAWHRATSEGPVLVFLHEGLGSVSTWKDAPRRLADSTGFPVFVYSRLGYGRSDPAPLPRAVSFMHEEARELPAILAALGIADTILVGHSDGASIALIAAADEHPDLRVRGLVLAAPHVVVEDLTVASIARARDAFRSTDLRERLARHHARVDETFRGWTEVWLDPAFRAWSIADLLPSVRVPSLVIQAEDDPYGTLAQVRVIERGTGGPLTTLCLPRGGHDPLRTMPAECDAAIVPFVRALAGRG